jgi:cell filamentation protein, protein adenylyltransferase
MTPCIPDTLPLETLDWGDLVTAIGQANAAVARYDGFLQGIVNPDILLTPLATREAVLSSRIEGTRASVDQVLEYEAEPDETKPGAADFHEVLNYRRAMFLAVDEMKKRPISLNLVKRIHEALLDGVRGKNMRPGEFRTVQNFIGGPTDDIADAAFIPPEPVGMMDHLDAFEKYIHSDDRDRIVQLAIVHAQFEIIHPFMDGNGRVGRILVPLFLYEKGLLARPTFYLSAYLESHRDEYVSRLRAITHDSDWMGWIRFFLRAVTEQAGENIDKASAILDLYDRMKVEIPRITGSKYSIQVLDSLFHQPHFRGPDFTKRSGIPVSTALTLLKSLEKAGVLNTIHKGQGRKASVMEFPELIRIVQA